MFGFIILYMFVYKVHLDFLLCFLGYNNSHTKIQSNKVFGVQF